MSIGLLIADDHPVILEGIRRIVEEHEDLRVIDEARDAEEAVRKSMSTEIDVLVLDISMPGGDFLQTMNQIKVKRPDLPILVLSIYPESQYAIPALKAGASGYLTKDHSPEELAGAIRQVCSGRKYVTPSIAAQLVDILENPNALLPHESLSRRERQVLKYIARGKSLKEISELLYLSPKTVSTYRGRILEKLNLKNNTSIVRYALDHKLID